MPDEDQQTDSAGNWSVVELIGRYQADIVIRNSLWTTYVVASFAGAGFFATTDSEVSSWARALVSLGFLSFTVGHAALIYSVMARLNEFESVFRGLPKSDGLEQLLANLGKATTIRFHYLAHVIIDACVLVLIWASAR